MKEVLEFIKANWQLIIAALVFILSFILQLLKKKPINDVLSYIYVFSVKAVKAVEESGVIGSQKKFYSALNMVRAFLCEEFPNINVDRYTRYIGQVIENILETPQKKGGSADGEKKTHDEK